VSCSGFDRKEFAFFTARFSQECEIIRSSESADAIDTCHKEVCSRKIAHLLPPESVGADTPLGEPLSGACSSVDDRTLDQELNQSLLGKFCMIKYDIKAYPGKILKVDLDDDDALIQCMAKVGENCYFWPVCQDIAWYMRQDILALINEPTPTGSGRHCEVDPVVYQRVLQKLHN